MSKFFSSISGVLLAAAGMHIVWLVAAKAYQDYGWLGSLVVLSIGLPFAFVLVPLVAWWIWPGTQAQVLYVILAGSAVFGFISSKLKSA